MQGPPIDLRSDTVTKPTPAMRRAMAEAEVGNDVFGDDPTVKGLEARVPNSSARKRRCSSVRHDGQPDRRRREHAARRRTLCSTTSHVYVWEAGGIARLSGVTARTFEGDGGVLSLDDLRNAVRPDDPHYVRTRLICLENTHNRGGGRPLRSQVSRRSADGLASMTWPCTWTVPG